MTMPPDTSGTHRMRDMTDDSASKAATGRRVRRAVIQALASGCVAAILAVVFQRRLAGAVVAAIGAGVLLCGLFLPVAFLALEHLARKLGHHVALLITWCVLVPFFYLCFVPGRLWLAFVGKDPLDRSMNASVTSYWRDWPHSQAPETYTRQY